MSPLTFVELVARLVTREEAHPHRTFDLPPLGVGDPDDALDALIYTARRILSEMTPSK
jgi:hypothetical protein